MTLIFNILLFILLVLAILFGYTQLATIITTISSNNYTIADTDKIFAGIPNWDIQIPFLNWGLPFTSGISSEVSKATAIWQWVKFFFVIILLALLFTLISGKGVFSSRQKTKYQRESYGHLMSKLERKRGLNRIEYTATENFNVYGGKGKITRHTIRCFLERCFRWLYVINNYIATEYNLPVAYRWNLQSGRYVFPDRKKIETLNIYKEENDENDSE